MSRTKSDTPGYRYHVSGQAVVTFDGRNFYLGEHGSPESKARYHALLARYLENGKRLPDDIETRQAEAVITVRVVTSEYRQHIKKRYANNRTETNRLENLCTTLEIECGELPAADFGPIKLEEIRELFIADGLCRTYVNRLVRHVKRIFKHAISRQLVGVNTIVWLDTLEPLKRGQSAAPEPVKVTPVDLEVVRETAKHLSPIIKAMIQLQASTGMRPGEVCNLRPCDIDKRPDGVWLYRPATHKTQHHGKERTIPIVVDVRITLGPYLERDPEAFCFSPRESMAWFRQRQRQNRKSSVQPSQVDRSKAKKKRQPGLKYLPTSYYQAVRNAAKRAKVDHWFPYQLRHTAATAVREALGIEAAQALLGHSRIDMTQHYANVTTEKAIEAARVAPSLDALCQDNE